LNDKVDAAYQEGLESLLIRPSVQAIATGARLPDATTTPSLLRTTAGDLVADAEHLLAECFGPVSLVAEYAEETEMLEVAEAIEGQLTATVHGEADEAIVPGLIEALAEKTGRVIWNGWPTGVAVTWAMQHGGPYPATTSSLHTSVGAASIARFLRPVAFQGVPEHLLPAGLQDANPLGLPRRVDGVYRPAP
jgi:NADP-dependent aldehyde dehydrogenase